MSDRNEAVFEALLKVAAKEVVNRRIDALPSCEELNRLHKPSPAFRKRIYRIINKHVYAKKLRRLSRMTGRVAVILCIVATLSTVAVMSVEASRTFILNTIIRFHEDHAVIEFIGDGGTATAEGFYGRIPYGLELISHQVTNGATVAVFVNREGARLFLTQNEADAAVFAVDTDYTEMRTSVIDGQEVYLLVTIDDFGLNSLMWRVGNTVFMLMSDISVNELVAIAEIFLQN